MRERFCHLAGLYVFQSWGGAERLQDWPGRLWFMWLLWSAFSKLRICRMLKSWVKPLVPMAAGADSFLWSKWSLRLGGFIVRMMKLSESEPPFRKHTTWPPAKCLTAPSMRGSHFLEVKGTLSLDIAPCPHLTLFLPEWGYSLMSNPWTGICWSTSIGFLYFYQWELISYIMLIKPLIFPIKSYFWYSVDLVSIKM